MKGYSRHKWTALLPAWGAAVFRQCLRRAEALASAEVFGVEDYAILDNPDCEVENTIGLRRELTPEEMQSIFGSRAVVRSRERVLSR